MRVMLQRGKYPGAALLHLGDDARIPPPPVQPHRARRFRRAATRHARARVPLRFSPSHRTAASPPSRSPRSGPAALTRPRRAPSTRLRPGRPPRAHRHPLHSGPLRKGYRDPQFQQLRRLRLVGARYRGPASQHHRLHRDGWRRNLRREPIFRISICAAMSPQFMPPPRPQFIPLPPPPSPPTCSSFHLLFSTSPPSSARLLPSQTPVSLSSTRHRASPSMNRHRSHHATLLLALALTALLTNPSLPAASQNLPHRKQKSAETAADNSIAILTQRE